MIQIKDVPNIRSEFDIFLKKLSLVIKPGSRFDHNFKEVQQAIKKENSGQRDFEREAHLRHSVAEISELKQIIEHIDNLGVSDEILKVKFDKILSGQVGVDSNIEGVHDESRNILFEISLACFLHEYGFCVDYEKKGDITISHEIATVGIECKRINGHPRKSIKKSLQRARKQLSKRQDEVDFGVIAIDVSPVFFDNGKLTFADSEETVRKAFNEMSRSFIDSNGHFWQKRNTINDPEFIPAIIICLKGTIFTYTNNFTANGFYLTVNNTSYHTTENFNAFKKITEPLLLI